MQGPDPQARSKPRPDNKQHLIARFRSDDLVVMARGKTPDPIPNSAVKTLSADGTAS